ncbi:MAG: hypothetical protein OJF59_001022 [Cytophagales bacterium]|jgi:uncharacterized protein (UPF0303 family)|nr:hypothetical protein [Bacteroidota bacterium]MBS1979984.1 hypothetical protein [Bacteroidota bacterium]WHZ07269.1 MAG: hypothetical protein OJF59_001022 [Cytophagales bacterium]
MSKRTKKSTTRNKTSSQRIKNKNQKEEREFKVKQDSNEDDRFDFGGLPSINLKKNLGCG